MSHGVECKTTNQKTRVRNFTKKKENRTALQVPRCRYFGVILEKVPLVPVSVLKKYRGTFVLGTAHL